MDRGLRKRVKALLPVPGPERILTLSTLVNTSGNGMFAVTSALYFTRIVGLTPTQFGLGLSVAAAVALAAMLPMGHFADRVSPTRLLVVSATISALAMVAYAFATGFVVFVAAASVFGAANSGSQPVRSTLIARVGGTEGRVRIRAYLRAVTNAGMGLGSLVGGLALAVDSPALYRGLLLLNAVSTLVSAGLINRLPRLEPLVVEQRPRRTEALRDHRYVSLTALNSVLAMHNLLLEVIVPLWIVRETRAPRWVVALTYLLNTLACVIFQVRASRGADDVRTAGQLQRRGAVFLALATLGYASAAWPRSAVAATVLILVGAAVHVTGELAQSAAGFGIGMGLPPEHLQGQYQAVWGLGWGMSSLFGPALLTALCLGWRLPGWLAVGAIFLAAGLLTPPLVERALRGRPVGSGS